MVDLLIGIIILQVIIYVFISYKIDKFEENTISAIEKLIDILENLNKSQEANNERSTNN